ncbi:MAG: copper resistance protein [Actinomycetota bacterium]|nr:copper resistance protein [Actinomycetota bacterium]
MLEPFWVARKQPLHGLRLHGGVPGPVWWDFQRDLPGVRDDLVMHFLSPRAGRPAHPSPAHRAVRLAAVALAMTLVALAGAAPALAHAELRGSTPRAGSTLAEPPAQVRLQFTETPARSTVALVRDGCGRDVTSDVTVDGQDLLVELDGGQPGEWSVAVAVLSGEDGHSSDVQAKFTVNGDPGCASPRAGASAPPAADPTSTALEPATGATSPAAGKAVTSDGGSSTGLWVLGAGTLGALGAAYLVRIRTRATNETAASRAAKPGKR